MTRIWPLWSSFLRNKSLDLVALPVDHKEEEEQRPRRYHHSYRTVQSVVAAIKHAAVQRAAGKVRHGGFILAFYYDCTVDQTLLCPLINPRLEKRDFLRRQCGKKQHFHGQCNGPIQNHVVWATVFCLSYVVLPQNHRRSKRPSNFFKNTDLTYTRKEKKPGQLRTRFFRPPLLRLSLPPLNCP